jgi:hypothetical protein
LNPGLLVEGEVALAGPAGKMRLLGYGAHLVLEADGVHWAAAFRAVAGRRSRNRVRALAQALESQRLRVDVEKGGRVLFSMGSGCRGGLLSRLLGGAPVARVVGRG